MAFFDACVDRIGSGELASKGMPQEVFSTRCQHYHFFDLRELEQLVKILDVWQEFDGASAGTPAFTQVITILTRPPPLDSA